MNIAASLRKIEKDLKELASEEPIDVEQVKIAAVRIGAQAEMIEKGLDRD